MCLFDGVMSAFVASLRMLASPQTAFPLTARGRGPKLANCPTRSTAWNLEVIETQEIAFRPDFDDPDAPLQPVFSLLLEVFSGDYQIQMVEHVDVRRTKLCPSWVMLEQGFPNAII